MSNRDSLQNSTVAAGGLLAALSVAKDRMPTLHHIDQPADCAPNQFDVRFTFMHSAYRVTVDILPGTSDEDILALSEQIRRENP